MVTCALSATLALAAAPQPLPGFLAETDGARVIERQLTPDSFGLAPLTVNGFAIAESLRERGTGCTNTATHTDASFTGGSYNAQAGFAEGEIAATSYTLPAAAFPIKLESVETILVSQASVSTTTEWSVLVWEGNPDTGNLVAIFQSDGVILPHAVLPPGPAGVNISVAVDPGDPEQVIITNNGTATFSVGFRIDQHNNQTQNPCFVAPPSNSNAFPATDTSGLAVPTQNWIFALDCGSALCPNGWARFSQINFLCRPTGDWVIRANWSSTSCVPGAGACCLPNDTCLELLAGDCAAQGGNFRGEGVFCSEANCGSIPQACCFPSTGGCLNLAPAQCTGAGGFPQGLNSTCGTTVCFPTGACCLPDGSCLDDLSPEDCNSQGGAYQGNDTTCAGVNCPPPTGACCFGFFCLELPEDDCMTAGGLFRGLLTTCDDVNGNGAPDACEGPFCTGDLTGDNVVDLADLGTLFGCWNTPCGDLDASGNTDLADLGILFGDWGCGT